MDHRLEHVIKILVRASLVLCFQARSRGSDARFSDQDVDRNPITLSLALDVAHLVRTRIDCNEGRTTADTLIRHIVLQVEYQNTATTALLYSASESKMWRLLPGQGLDNPLYKTSIPHDPPYK